MTDSLHSTPTVIAGYAIAIARALDARGVSSKELLRAAGIEQPLSANPLSRLPFTATNRLVELSLEATGDPYFGLTIARYIHPHLHAVSHAAIASNNLLDLCERLERFFPLLSQEGVLRVEKTDNEVAVSLDPVVDFPGELLDGFLGFLIHFMRLNSSSKFSPLRVELARPEPQQGPEPFESFYKAPVSFEQPVNTFHFSLQDMRVPLVTANPDLAQVLDHVLVDYLGRLDKSDIVWRAENIIIELLSAGEVSAEKVAERLNMAPGTLAVKLSERNTGIQALLDEIRQKLSKSYLHQQDLSITEITYMLGYTDTSSYSRACKRWTGLSPRDYRESLKKV